MVSFHYVIKDEVGIHARPAGQLVKEATNYVDDIQISCKGKTVDMKRLMALLSLGAKKDDEVTVEVTGDSEVETAEKLELYFTENL